MKKYATISVPVDVKKVLEKVRGREEWGKFLFNLYIEVKSLRSKKAFEQLASTLTDEDLKTIFESSREFRKRFRFR